MMARPGRTAAVVGAVVAFAAVTLMGMLAGSASASTPGSCLENVNVRAEPTTDARIVALCEAGTAVTTGAVRNGFVRIENLGGWAAEEYIDIEGAPSSNTRTAPSTSGDDAPTTSAPRTTAPRTDDAATSRTGDDDVQRDTGDSTADSTPSSTPRSSSGGGSTTGDTAGSTGSTGSSGGGTGGDDLQDEADDDAGSDEPLGLLG
jgi:uncharacterized protein YraI